jgi:hypothetical protein
MALRLILLLGACAGESADSIDAPAPEVPQLEPGTLAPGTYEAQRGDCRGPVEVCGARDWCYVVESYERLDESGCSRQHVVPVGCARTEIAVQEAVTGALGPDGACWTFLDSGIPADFGGSYECGQRVRQAPVCAD